MKKSIEVCPNCENEFPHLCTDGKYWCEECECIWDEKGIINSDKK